MAQYKDTNRNMAGTVPAEYDNMSQAPMDLDYGAVPEGPMGYGYGAVPEGPVGYGYGAVPEGPVGYGYGTMPEGPMDYGYGTVPDGAVDYGYGMQPEQGYPEMQPEQGYPYMDPGQIYPDMTSEQENADKPGENWPLVSVIIPVYNLEDYVEECIRSVMEQTYTKLEILVVDDGSADNSGDIVSRLAEEDERILLKIQENRGVSAARNKALRLIKGDFYIFLDGDDTLEPTAVQELLVMQQEHPEDFIVCERSLWRPGSADPAAGKKAGDEGHLSSRTKKEDSDGHLSPRRKNAEEAQISRKEACLDIREGKYCLQSACQKLFCTETGRKENLSFNEEIHQGEDGLYVSQYMKQVSRVYYSPRRLWNVRVRSESASHAPLDKKWMGSIRAMDLRIADETDARILEEYRRHRVELLVLYIGAYICRNSNDRAFLEDLRRRLRRDLKEYKEGPATPKEKIAARFYAGMPVWVIRLYLALTGKKL